jgi:hypothetical protein
MSSRLLLVMLAIVVSIIVVLEFAHWREARNEARLVEQAAELKRTIDAQFPPGATQVEVVKFLRAQPGTFRSELPSGFWLSVGQQRSKVPYCGAMEIGIVAEFSGGRFVHTRVTTWSVNCV